MMDIVDKKYGFGEHMNGYYDVTPQLSEYLRSLAQKHLAVEAAEKAALTTTAQFEARRERTRRRFIDALGGLDFERTPLNPRVTGEFDFEGFTVKKVIYESRPQMYVSANLYVPHGLKGPSAAVLMACGHSADGKACETYQQVAIDLANNGLIVLLVDPVGQGERLQYNDFDENGKNRVGTTTYEHTYEGGQCILTGSNVAGYMMWDLIRGVDYLESLDIVDNARIGMTGNSGGGTQTEYMMCCEPRLACAMPCCYTTSKINYMKAGQIHDAEQNVWGVISGGVNYDDLITCMAPKPARIGCARFDFFCIEGAEKTYNSAKKIYALYGEEDKLSMAVTDATHGFTVGLRQSAVNFFRHYLLGLDESFVADRSRSILPAEKLWASKSGHLVKDLPDLKPVWAFNVERLDAVHYADTSDRAALRARVIELLNLPQELNDRPEIHYPRVISDIVTEGVRVRKVFFFTEEDIVCGGVLLSDPQRESDTCTVYVSNDSTNEIYQNRADLLKLLEKGDVFVFDPRGIGSAASRVVYLGNGGNAYGTIFNNYYKLNCDAVMLGTSLYALRVYDILRACDLMGKRGYFGYAKIALAGRGYGSFDTLTAAALLDDADVTVCGDPIVFETLVRTQYYPVDPRLFIHGLLTAYDSPLLMKVLGAKQI